MQTVSTVYFKIVKDSIDTQDEQQGQGQFSNEPRAILQTHAFADTETDESVSA